MLVRSFRIQADVNQYSWDILEAELNQPETHMWLTKCLPEGMSHICQKLSSLTTLWTFIQVCASIIVFKETIGHWTLRRTEASAIESAR